MRARTCALFRTNAEATTKSGGKPRASHHRLWRWPNAAALVLALIKAQNIHVLRFSKADVLALHKVHFVCRHNSKGDAEEALPRER